LQVIKEKSLLQKIAEEAEKDRTYYNLIHAIRRDETKIKYDYCIKDFMNFNGVDRPSLLLNIEIERKIIDYILHLRDLNLASSTIRTRVAGIYLYYAMNDVLLNKVKINKYKGEFVKVTKDRPYSREEIHRLLDIADLRMKVCILLMASAGLRLGALPLIQWKHLKKIDKCYKITVYENSNEEYVAFCSMECASFIDEYVNYRVRNGENITPESYLIRNDLNVYQSLSIRIEARPITKHTVREIIAKLLLKSGVATKEVHQTHGFRKFFINQLFEVEPDIKAELRWLLEGHKLKANDPAYVRTSEKHLLEAYLRGVNNLTINEEFRLKEKVEKLEIQKDKFDSLKSEFDKFKQQVNLMQKKK
jgi:integrase